MTTSTIPDAYDAVVTALTPLLTAESASTYDGPPNGRGYKDYVCIGHDPSSGDQATTTTTQWSQIGAFRQSESFRIPCLIVCPAGDGSFTLSRRRAYALLDVILNALRGVSFTGQVMPLHVVEHELLQERSEGIALACGIRFTIACEDARFLTS